MGKKRDARIARKVERDAKREAGQARLRERVAAEIAETRTPRLGVDPGSIFHLPMTWTAAHADQEDSWSWGQPRAWGDEAWRHDIQPRLIEYQAYTWSQLDGFNTGSGHKMHHSMAVESIDAEPQARLMELGIEHDGDIFRFRLTPDCRLWGFRVRAEFQVLWYDPYHKVYSLDPR